MSRRVMKMRGRDMRIKARGTAHQTAYDLMIVTLGVLCAFLTVVLVFALLRLNGWFELRRQAADGLRFAAEEVIDKTPGDKTPAANAGAEEGDQGEVVLEIEKFNGHAYLGQSDVRFLKFSLVSKEDAQLRQLVLALDGYARPHDVKNLQLYFEGKFMAEVPFFEGKGLFDDLRIALPAGEKMFFEVRGKVSEEAFSGDRLQIGFKDENAFSIRGEDAALLKVEGDFPLWGGYISIIGNKRG